MFFFLCSMILSKKIEIQKKSEKKEKKNFYNLNYKFCFSFFFFRTRFESKIFEIENWIWIWKMSLGLMNKIQRGTRGQRGFWRRSKFDRKLMANQKKIKNQKLSLFNCESICCAVVRSGPQRLDFFFFWYLSRHQYLNLDGLATILAWIENFRLLNQKKKIFCFFFETNKTKLVQKLWT